jgi:hypothetical protein
MCFMIEFLHKKQRHDNMDDGGTDVGGVGEDDCGSSGVNHRHTEHEAQSTNTLWCTCHRCRRKNEVGGGRFLSLSAFRLHNPGFSESKADVYVEGIEEFDGATRAHPESGSQQKFCGCTSCKTQLRGRPPPPHTPIHTPHPICIKPHPVCPF